MLRRPSAEEFRQRVVGQTIRELSRRGKYLIFHLDNGEALLLHFRMSGSLQLQPAPYLRAIFTLEDGLRLHFCDRRKLGTMELVKNETEVTGRLGAEPLEEDFTTEVLAHCLSHHKAPIKAVLMDQSVIAGIGNMYADEALFFARIHPLRQAESLSAEEVEQLHHAICQVLNSAIGNRGASISDYRDPYAQPGRQQFFFSVAHRGGKPCPICGAAIERISIRNRGSYFCPQCQRM
jgi:formamidopyrimidine-DNA glycosylase